MHIIFKYFPEISDNQQHQYAQLQTLYDMWNAKINVISRKDITLLYERHVLHALSIAKVQEFSAGSRVLDVGTGGGFPGIPLAIQFPETHFYLIDAIGKKIKVVNAVVEALGLKNVSTAHIRAEAVTEQFDFVVSRAVTAMPDFVKWIRHRVRKKSDHALKNGILYLKGGDLSEELKPFPKAVVYPICDFFEEDFFETKKVVYLPLKYKP